MLHYGVLRSLAIEFLMFEFIIVEVGRTHIDDFDVLTMSKNCDGLFLGADLLMMT